MAERGHGHESAEKHGGGEWLGPKLKQFLKAAGLTMFLSTALFSAACLPIVPAYIAAQGAVGGGVSIWGWNAAKGGSEHKKKRSHGSGGH